MPGCQEPRMPGCLPKYISAPTFPHIKYPPWWRLNILSPHSQGVNFFSLSPEAISNKDVSVSVKNLDELRNCLQYFVKETFVIEYLDIYINIHINILLESFLKGSVPSRWNCEIYLYLIMSHKLNKASAAGASEYMHLWSINWTQL